MVDIVLLIGRLLFVALLFVFLFAIMKTGIGLVQGQQQHEKEWTVAVQKGPKELRGVSIKVHGPVIVGRNPGSDIVIGAGFVSGRHARFSLKGNTLYVEDLHSTTGTTVNGTFVNEPTSLHSGDIVAVGDVEIRATYA